MEERLIAMFRERFGEEQAKKMAEAISFASRVHCNQKRDDGTPFVTHPLTVASYLLDM